jgi:hypothetical protein
MQSASELPELLNLVLLKCQKVMVLATAYAQVVSCKGQLEVMKEKKIEVTGY